MRRFIGGSRNGETIGLGTGLSEGYQRGNDGNYYFVGGGGGGGGSISVDISKVIAAEPTALLTKLREGVMGLKEKHLRIYKDSAPLTNSRSKVLEKAFNEVLALFTEGDEQ